MRNKTVEKVLGFFGEISKIPRCSEDEKKISDFLVNFGEDRGLEVHRDAFFNVIIKKPASVGYENAPTVILQGHMDMVCEKDSRSEHDFSKDPIEILMDGEFLSAKDTTLGADNGIALAYCLTILDASEINHPPLEILFTTQEEIGLIGAGQLDRNQLDGKILINIDAEAEGVLFTSCAGGIRCKIKLPIERAKSHPLNTFELKISRLKGGHSGMEIDKHRANANILLGRVLKALIGSEQIFIAHVTGGSKVNAITREAHAIIGIEASKIEKVKEKCEYFEALFRNEFKSSDGDVKIDLTDQNFMCSEWMDAVTSKKLLNLYTLSPYGVMGMSADIDNLVESSVNLGIIQTEEDSITVMSSVRSSVESIKFDIVDKIRTIADLLDLEMETMASYPAWEYRQESYIRGIFKNVYEKQFGKSPMITAIHAGLECGVLGNILGDVDMISFGPDIYDVHTPQERIRIDSIDHCWHYLCGVLENIR